MTQRSQKQPGFFKRYMHRNHRSLALIQYRFRRRITPAGWVVILATIAVAALGADTNASLGYQTFALLAVILLLAVLSAPLGRPRLAIERSLPRFGSVGQRLRYQLRVQNLTDRKQGALKLIEDLPDPRPTLTEYAETPEPGEERRNWVDRVFGVYRWRWLVARNQRARIEEINVPNLAPWEECEVNAWLEPLRRGVLRLNGTTVACPDPFGSFDHCGPSRDRSRF